MKVNIKMPSQLKSFFYSELDDYKLNFLNKNLDKAWRNLERVHVLGQNYPYEHSLVHFKMLVYGFKTKNTKEIIGQIPRLLLGGVKSFVDKVPVGNTGGANVPPLKSLPIENELLEILNKIKN
jgi:hypothetical protein